MDCSEVVKFISENRGQVNRMIKGLYMESLTHSPYLFDKKLLIYNGELVVRDHVGYWSQEETYSDAICIYRVTGSDEGFTDDEAVESLMNRFDVNRLTDSIVERFRSFDAQE